MKYSILFTARAKKDIDNLPSPIYTRIINALDVISENPFAGKMLRGELLGLRSHRVGDYRIIYKIEQKKVVVIVLTIGNRKEVYRNK